MNKNHSKGIESFVVLSQTTKSNNNFNLVLTVLLISVF